MFDLILPTLLIFGFWTSYTDIKKGLIKNYSVIAMIILSILLNVFVTKSFVNYTAESIINIFAALAIGIIIWLAGMWSAADAKLLIAFTMMVPVTIYKFSTISYFPGISILINALGPIFLVLFFQIIFRTSMKQKRFIILEVIKPISIINIFLSMLAIISIFYGLSHFLKISIDLFLAIMILFTIFWLVEQKMKLKLTYFFIAVNIISLILFYKIMFTINFLINWIVFSFVVLAIVFLINLSKFINTMPVKLSDIKEKMVPAEVIFKRGEKYFKEQIFFIALQKSLRDRAVIKPIF